MLVSRVEPELSGTCECINPGSIRIWCACEGVLEYYREVLCLLSGIMSCPYSAKLVGDMSKISKVKIGREEATFIVYLTDMSHMHLAQQLTTHACMYTPKSICIHPFLNLQKHT